MTTSALPTPLPLGAYVLPGRANDPRPAIEQARTGERIGLSSIWLSDRWDAKELGAMAGTISQAITRPRIIAGATHFNTRHPVVLGGLATTVNALSNGRFELGIARSAGGTLRQFGITLPTMQAVADYATILRRLWAGEKFSYDGPAGTYTDLHFTDIPPTGGPPLLLAGSGPKALAVAGTHYDGIILTPFLTPDGIRKAIEIVRNAAADAGRDAESIKVYGLVVVAPDLPQAEQDAVVIGRAVTYFQTKAVAHNTSWLNGWDEKVFEPVQNHPMFQGVGAVDHYTREELVEVGRLIPEDMLFSGAAVGTADEVASRLPAFLDAGANEIVLHGASTDQCVNVAAEFRTLTGL